MLLLIKFWQPHKASSSVRLSKPFWTVPALLFIGGHGNYALIINRRAHYSPASPKRCARARWLRQIVSYNPRLAQIVTVFIALRNLLTSTILFVFCLWSPHCVPNCVLSNENRVVCSSFPRGSLVRFAGRNSLKDLVANQCSDLRCFSVKRSDTSSSPQISIKLVYWLCAHGNTMMVCHWTVEPF